MNNGNNCMETNNHNREYENPYNMSIPMVGFCNKIFLVIQVLTLIVHPMLKITIISCCYSLFAQITPKPA